MAKVTDTTVIPPAPTPPRTFTVELSEVELATLVLVLGDTNSIKRKERALVVAATRPAFNTSHKAAQIVAASEGEDYYLYSTLSDALNA